MNPLPAERRPRALSDAATRVRALLRRYPDLTATELERLIAAFRGLSVIDTGLLMADAALAERLGAFLRCHGSRTGQRWGHWLLIGPIVLLFMLLWIATIEA